MPEYDFSYLVCPGDLLGNHRLGYQADVHGVVTCIRCGWRAAPAWIVQVMVNMDRDLSLVEKVRRNAHRSHF